MRAIALVTGLVLGAAVTAGSPADARAQWGIAPHIGYHFDAEEVHLGSTVQFNLPVRVGTSRLIAAPGFDYYPFLESVAGVGSSSMYMVNMDLLYPVPSPASIAPYLGAGLVVSHASVTVNNPLVPGTTLSSGNTDLGLNLKGGAQFNKGKAMRPFGEAVLMIGNGSTLLLRGGVYFSIGSKS